VVPPQFTVVENCLSPLIQAVHGNGVLTVNVA